MIYIFLQSVFAAQFFGAGGLHMNNNVTGFLIKQVINMSPRSVGITDMASNQLFGSAKFSVKRGTLSDIHSMERSGDEKLEASAGGKNVILTFTFKKLKVVYSEVTMSLLGLSTCGVLEGTVDSNLFRISARISEDIKCFLALNKFDVVKLGKFNVKFTHEKRCPMVPGISKVTTMAVNFFKGKIRKKVEEGIHKVLRELIKPNKLICVEV